MWEAQSVTEFGTDATIDLHRDPGVRLTLTLIRTLTLNLSPNPSPKLPNPNPNWIRGYDSP